MTSVVVIGGGIVGCSIAWALATDGLDVTIVERASGVGMGSTSASSAIVRMHYSTFEGVAVSWEAKQCWEDWAGHLGVVDESGMARYIQTGMLMLDTPGYDSSRVMGHYDRFGIPYEVLSADEIRARFPYLAPDRFYPPRAIDDERFGDPPTGEIGGFYTTEAGFVDDPALGAHNLWVAASAAGAVSRFRSTVTSIDRDGDRVAGVTVASGDRLAAEVVVNAAGPHSAAINTLAGVLDDFAISTRPLRQEVHQVGGPPELDGEVGVTVGDGDLGGYYRFTPGGGVLVGSQEPDCDDLEWLEDPDANNINPTVAGFERQTLRLARRMPSITIPNRPTGLAAAYDVSDDWIPIYDRTSLPGYFVAIGTSGNQFKNAPVIGSLVTAIVADSLRGGDHDAHPVTWHAPRIGVDVGLGHYSRLRSPNAASSNSVLG